MEEFLVATLRYGNPLVYVTLAGVLSQRAGVWNLGLEGLMIIGCCASVLGFVRYMRSPVRMNPARASASTSILPDASVLRARPAMSSR